MNSSETCAGVAASCCASAGRIGSTSPIPMNEMTQAKATAQTAFGWRNGLTPPPGDDAAPCDDDPVATTTSLTRLAGLGRGPRLVVPS